MADESNPNRLIIEVVLDDGSVAKGFAKVAKQAEDAAKSSKKQFETIGDVLNADAVDYFTHKLKEIPVAFVGTGLVIAAIGAALKEAFDLTLAGEKLRAVEIQFNSLAEGAGIVGETLKSALEKSANGLIDTGDLLKTANSAIVELGTNASKLPQVLELSRKATLALGGSLQERFDQIVSGIETGNGKILRSAGIIVDVEKANKTYAASLGLTASELTRAQQQQALLNAVLEQGNEKFKNVASGAQPLTVGMKQISVALKEATEQVELFINAKLGPTIASAAGFVADSLRAINKENGKSAAEKQAEDLASMRAEMISLEYEIPRLTKQFEEQGILARLAFGKERADEINAARARYDEINETLKKTAIITNNVAEAISNSSKVEVSEASVANINRLSQEQILAIKARNAEIVDLGIKAQQDFINQQESQISNIQLFEQQKAAILDTQRQQELLNDEIFQQQREAIAVKYSAEKGFSASQREEALNALTFEQSNKRLALEVKTAAALKALDENTNKARISGWSGFFGNLAALQKSGSAEFIAIGKAAALVQATIDGYAAVTSAYAAGSKFGPATAAAFAAAAALAQAINIANIAGVGGGGGGSSFSPDVGSGGISSGPSRITDITSSSDIERNPKQSINVVLNGDILGDEASGNKIISMINAAFDTTGVQLRNGLA